MGLGISAPDKDLLPTQFGTVSEYMATLHKWWESLPLNFLGGLTRNYKTNI